MLWFNTQAAVKAETLRDTLVKVRSQQLGDALGYPQAEEEAKTQIDLLAKNKAEAIMDALVQTLAEVNAQKLDTLDEVKAKALVDNLADCATKVRHTRTLKTLSGFLPI